MPLPLIPIAMALAAEFAPKLIDHLVGDEAGKIAQQVVNVAERVTGKPADQAAEALRTDPELARQFTSASFALQTLIEQEDTKRLQAINETIRVELTSDDKFVRRMRPYVGYIIGTTFGLQMMAVTYAIIFEPALAPNIISALAALSTMWGIGLSVIGVYVWRRTDEKKASIAANDGPALGDNLKEKLGGLLAGLGKKS